MVTFRKLEDGEDMRSWVRIKLVPDRTPPHLALEREIPPELMMFCRMDEDDD